VGGGGGGGGSGWLLHHKIQSSRHLAKFKVHVSAIKNAHLLRPVKDDIGCRALGMYYIPSECGKVYVGQPGLCHETTCLRHKTVQTRQVNSSRASDCSIALGTL
jgi:hypothetical protein